MSTTAARTRVRELLRSFVKDTDLDDPYAIAIAFGDAYGDELDLYEVLDELVPVVVRTEFAVLRGRAAKAVGKNGGYGRGKTNPARDEARRRNNEILKTWRVSVVGKRLLECNATDLRLAAQVHEQRAANDVHRADQYMRLAQLAEREGARTLADVNASRIYEALDAESKPTEAAV